LPANNYKLAAKLAETNVKLAAKATTKTGRNKREAETGRNKRKLKLAATKNSTQTLEAETGRNKREAGSKGHN
jgi:hypothetical protein